MKKSITILSFIFAFFLFTGNAEASFLVKKNTSEVTVKDSLEKNAPVASTSASMASGKSQIVAAVLCFFLGGIGVHRFYLGYIWQGVVQILTFGGLGIWVLIDFIRILLGDLGPKNGSYSSTF